MLPGEVRYGIWHGPETPQDFDLGESVVTVIGEPCEIHCHGGEVAARRILDDLKQCGVAIVDQSQWLSAAVPELLIREATQVLLQTTTTRTAAIAMDQVRGALQRFVHQCDEWIASGNEQGVKFVHASVREILRHADVGMHLGKPWNVVLAGPPNVGKSSLINALLGYRRSITVDQPGTTRDVLQADAVIDGWPIRLSDTAGIRSTPGEKIEREGIDRAIAAIRDADLVLWVYDATQPIRDDEFAGLPQPAKSIVVRNKIDLAIESEHSPIPARSGLIDISATKPLGVDTLQMAIIASLVPEALPPGCPVPLNVRQVDVLRKITNAKTASAIQTLLSEMTSRRDKAADLTLPFPGGSSLSEGRAALGIRSPLRP